MHHTPLLAAPNAVGWAAAPFVARRSGPQPLLPLQRAPAMPLDNDPIYCAEQIVIPPDLGDILKAYAKEVIRNEPDDIFEFSAK